MTRNIWRSDPGPCVVCGAAHTACTSTARHEPIVAGAIRSATTVIVRPKTGHPPTAREAAQNQRTLLVDEFSTSTYRGRKSPGVSRT